VTDSTAWWLAVDGPRTWAAIDWPAERLAALRRRRLRGLLAAAVESPFHRERLRALGVDSRDPAVARAPEAALAMLPPLGKAELRAAGAAALAGGEVRSGWRCSRSSGTSGEPFRVYFDPRAWATLKYLVKLRARRACGVRLGDRVALLDAIPPAAAPAARAGRWTCVSVLQSPASVAAALTLFEPTVIYGLPSALLEAARALGLRARALGTRVVFTSGELLDPATRAALAGAFQAQVFDVYGTSETKDIAWECAHGGLHLNADVTHLEVLDDDDRPVPSGVEGNLVVTSLVNRAMPLLRYRTGDRGALQPDDCACGRALPLLGLVTGRAADTLVFAGGQRVSPYALTCALESVEGILRYQVTQLDHSRVRVRAIAAPAADRALASVRMVEALRAGVGPFLLTDVEFVDRLPSGPRAKFRVVQPSA
jgi:phenylacetate-CoA ligase